MHYPQVVFAALASSAPLRCQLVGGRGWNATDFWAVVTRTASPEAGADPACVPNSRAAFAALFDLAETPEVGGCLAAHFEAGQGSACADRRLR